MNALEVVSTKKESTPTSSRSAKPLKGTTTKKMSAVQSSNSSLVNQDVPPSRKERGAPSSDNPREVRKAEQGYSQYVCSLWLKAVHIST